MEAPAYSLAPTTPRLYSDTPLSVNKTYQDEAPALPMKSPFVRRPLTLYLGYLTPITIVFVATVAFMIHLSIHGAISSSQWITNKTLQRPRETAQVVTIIASLLTATVTWSLSNAATIFAQKRFFKQFRPIMEIEILSAIKNIGIVWGWQYSKRAMFLTWLVFAACALLTSGFVSLISPLAIAKRNVIAGSSELNFAAAAQTCFDWFTTAKNQLIPSDGGLMICDYKVFRTFSYSSCLSVTQLPQAFSAATATVLGYFAAFQPIGKQSNFVTSYTNFNNSRILGGTAGTLPTGPAGLQVFDFPTLKRSSDRDNYNYTLNLQGLWLDTTCGYEVNSGFTFAFNQTVENINKYTVGCPNTGVQTWDIPKGLAFNGITIAFPCFEPDRTSVYWRSLNINGTNNRDAVDLVRCDLTPRVGTIQADYFANLAAFKMNRTFVEPPPASSRLSKDIITQLVQELVYVVYYSQSEVGNAWVDLLRSLGQSYGGLPAKAWEQPNDLVPVLIGLAIQGIFEFQATTMRIMLNAKAQSDLPAPAECLRPVTGEFVEGLIGWNLQSATILGFIPLFIIMLTATTLMILATRIKGRLTIFDPTNPSSLIAATSAGDVKLPPDEAESAITGQLKQVAKTKIAFGDDGGRWGFKTS